MNVQVMNNEAKTVARATRIRVALEDALENALAAVNGKAKAHTVDAAHLVALAREVEETLLARGLPKSKLPGTEIAYIPAGPGKAYSRKGRRVVSTYVVLKRGSSAWYLLDAAKVEIWADKPEDLQIFISPAARDAIVAKALDGLSIQKSEVDDTAVAA